MKEVQNKMPSKTLRRLNSSRRSKRRRRNGPKEDLSECITLNGLATEYLCNMVEPYTPDTVLRSASQNLLAVPL